MQYIWLSCLWYSSLAPPVCFGRFGERRFEVKENFSIFKLDNLSFRSHNWILPRNRRRKTDLAWPLLSHCNRISFYFSFVSLEWSLSKACCTPHSSPLLCPFWDWCSGILFILGYFQKIESFQILLSERANSKKRKGKKADNKSSVLAPTSTLFSSYHSSSEKKSFPSSDDMKGQIKVFSTTWLQFDYDFFLKSVISGNIFIRCRSG